VSQPTALSAPAERHPCRRRRLLLALAGTAAVLVAGAVTLSGYHFFAVRGELAAAIAETDRLDPGWRFEELEARRRLPPAERNAALQVLKVHSSIPPGWHTRSAPAPAALEAGPDRVDDVLHDLAPERQVDERQTRRLRTDLKRAGPALAQARKLGDLPEGRYPVAWTADVVSTPCPWSDALSETPTLLRLDALLRAQDGDPDAALTSCRALLNLARSVGDEPFFNGPLSRMARCREAVRAVERTLAQGQPSEGALAAVQGALTREEAVSLLLPHFRGERAGMHVFLTRVDEGKNRISEMSCTPTRGLRAHAETWLGRLDALHEHAWFLRDINEAVEIAKLPPEQQWPLYQEWRRRKGFVENVGDGLRVGPAEGTFLVNHALVRCALVALAAERYRRAQGDWPRAPANLVPGYLPAVPLDPFDGAPLRYRRTDDGVVVYSVGEDGRDDGGDANPPPNGGWPPDVVFTLWDVARRRQPPKPPAGRNEEAAR
jgi:hypothetical protein